MALLIPRPGVALLIDSPARFGETTKHLHVLLTGPLRMAADDFVVIVSLSSVRAAPSTDRTCILGVGDHAFIKHPSFMFYAKARRVEARSLQRGIDRGQVRIPSTFDDAVTKRVIRGALTSDRTPIEIVETLKQVYPDLRES